MLDDPSDRSLLAAASGLAEALRSRYRTAMVERGFPWHQSSAAELLVHIPPDGTSQSALTIATGLSKQAVQQALDGLEAHGVIRREIDPADRRARRVVLTELGRRDVVVHREVVATIEAENRSALGRRRHKRLKKALRRLLTP
ncbi:MAG: MarR family transcriptional regulator [Devosia sp.]